MGVHNRQRRAAKKRARARRGAGQPHDTSWTPWQEPALTAADVRALLVEVIADIGEDATAARRCAEVLLAPGRLLTPQIARAGVLTFLGDLVRGATTSGWSPTDLAQVTRRRASAAHVPVMVGLLHEEAARHAADRVPAAWREDLRRAGAPTPPALDDVPGMQTALELLTLLARLPQLPPVLPAPGTSGQSRASSRRRCWCTWSPMRTAAAPS